MVSVFLDAILVYSCFRVMILRAAITGFVVLLSSLWAEGVEEAEYGVDCSWPIHHADFRCGDLLGDRKQLYQDFMKGCRERYSDKPDRCNTTETARLEMSLRQPQSYFNYTELGYTKMKAPQRAMELVLEHWHRNLHQIQPEEWPHGYTYTNHWDAPTYMASVHGECRRC
mmetsp:Transcript_22391/g.32098  ORF Transcript_22391/g.32098 Transcript_22391/m.32098 type:complete len:170 (-) Transcript_22391:975-1484(-)